MLRQLLVFTAILVFFSPVVEASGRFATSGTLPNAHVPNAHVPNAHVPNAHVPNAHVPNAHVPADVRLGQAGFFSDWETLTTAHFNIHYQSHHLEFARRMAAIAEHVYTSTTQWLEWEPDTKTEIVINDSLDASNGSASPLPYNRFSIYMPAPVDGQLLSDQPWLELVFTHEFIHILHLDQAQGFPGILRKIFGRLLLLFPQAYSPKWITEGLAVYGETDIAKKFGRGQSPMYEAMMRAEVMNGLRTQTEVSYHGYVGTDWPQGQVYLYGYYFFEFIEQNYGKEKVVEYVKNWNSNIIPWRMDSRAKDVFGVSGDRLWELFGEFLRQRFVPQIQALTETRNHLYREMPDQKLPATIAAEPYRNENPVWLPSGDFYYGHDNGHEAPVIIVQRSDGSRDTIGDVSAGLMFDVNRNRQVIMSRFQICDNTRVYADLYSWTDERQSWQRLTKCGRYIRAYWNPMGDRIAAVKLGEGKSTLQLLDQNGVWVKDLLALGLGDAIGDLSWSPRGDRVVVAVKRQRTGWQLELIDVSAGLAELPEPILPKNMPVEVPSRPQFNKTGDALYFIADRDGVLNVQRFDLLSGQLSTVTHTLTAVTDFALSATEDQIRFVEYSARGTQIRQAPLITADVALPDAGPGIVSWRGSSRSEGIDVLPEQTGERPVVPAFVNSADYNPDQYNQIEDYQPWSSMRPRSWWVWFYAEAEDNTAAQLVLDGSDALGNHFWQLAPTLYSDRDEIGGDYAYIFNGRIVLLASRQLDTLQDESHEQAGVWDIEQRYQALYMQPFNSLEQSFQLDAGLGYEKTTRRNSINSETLTRTDNLTGIRFSWDTREEYLHSNSPEHGRQVALSAEHYGLLDNSSVSEGAVLMADWREYFSLGSGHVISLRWIEADADDRAQPFRLGGFIDGFETIAGAIGFGRRELLLRGYDDNEAELTGHRARTLSLEWRLPITEIYDGWLYPPAGLGQLALTVFMDAGAAWENHQEATYYSSLGIEFRPTLLLGYDLLPLDLSVGFARGLDDTLGKSQVYLRLGAGF